MDGERRQDRHLGDPANGRKSNTSVARRGDARRHALARGAGRARGRGGAAARYERRARARRRARRHRARRLRCLGVRWRGLHRAARRVARRGRGRRQRVEGEQGDLRRPVHAGRRESSAAPPLLGRASRITRRDDRPPGDRHRVATVGEHPPREPRRRRPPAAPPARVPGRAARAAARARTRRPGASTRVGRAPTRAGR